MKSIMTLVAAILLSISGFGQTKTFLDVPYIEVNGIADTMVTPNEIYIKFVISESDVKNRKSIEEQEKIVVGGLKSLGIHTEKNLTTSDIQSDFKFYVLKQRDILKSKEYKLQVATAMLATKVFMKLEELGISNANIESTGHSEIESIRNTCRSNAIINAHKKAIALTSPIKASIGAPLHIIDYSNEINEPIMASPKMTMHKMMMEGAKEEVLPEINFEKMKISVSVNVKFILK